MLYSFVASAAVIAAAATIATSSAAPMPTGTWPTSMGNVKYDKPYVVKVGKPFDGGMKTYERSNKQCTGNDEGDKDGAVFIVEPGAILKNVIIGKAQSEGVHCEEGGCTIENVWWDDVCEDALSIKGGSASSVSNVIGGGARYAKDKIIQHNGYGTVNIDGFYAQDFGKLYRSCGTCKTKISRKVSISNVYAVNPTVGIATVNKNYGDEARLSNIKIKTSKKISDLDVCGWSEAVFVGEPGWLGRGPSHPLCQYAESTIQFIK
ncbi:Pectate lyase, partial [Globisporangium splendens]